jgi:hypothetical protein
MLIPTQDSEVEYFLVDLMMNYGVCPVERYCDIERRFPSYFNEHGFCHTTST